MNVENVTIEQIDLMKHAIGYERSRVKKDKYKAWRNYFCSYQDDADWGILIFFGFATKRNSEATYYFVTRKGLDFLEKLLDIKIVEEGR